jgi:hypothetical protein
MSTPNFSNFISNFTDLSNIDIVSSVSNARFLYNNFTDNSLPMTNAFTYNARYFCLCDLLIQFNDFGTYGVPTNTISSSSNDYTIQFNPLFDTKPYTVLIFPYNNTNNSSITVTSFTENNFNVKVSSKPGIFCFVAIGPRPSSLYTS